MDQSCTYLNLVHINGHKQKLITLIAPYKILNPCNAVLFQWINPVLT